MGNVIVELKDVRKEFPGVVALDNMFIQLKEGEVHGLIGENGAGKSTLIKILTGVYQPNKGQIFVNGKEVHFDGPSDSMAMGISCVYQELNMVKELPIVDNMFLGNHVKKGKVFLDYDYMKKKTTETLESMGQHISPTEITGNLGMGQQQMIEIGKAVMRQSKVIILDEPTSSLGEKEAEELFATVNRLKKQGVAILFVSHKLEELFTLCDVVTVMRDGEHISTRKINETNHDLLISEMVGRSLENMYPKIPGTPGDVALEVKGFSRTGEFKDISFEARRGEILGFAGLVGAGRTELMRAIFAATKADAGEVFVDGKKVNFKTPKDAIKNGIAFLTEDRKQEGLVLQESILRNLSLVNLGNLRNGIFVDDSRVRAQAKSNIERLQIKTPSANKLAGELSGGNQQKVVIGKWMNANADIYIFDEPTRGIDVGAKTEVYGVMNDLVKDGKCVIMISSELPEILGMCDKVVVMRSGRITGKVERGSKYFNQEDIMNAAWGGKLGE